MPSHVYKPGPPLTWWKRVLVHPYENVLSVFYIILGLMFVVRSVVPTISPSPSMGLLPWWASLDGMEWDVE